MKASAKLPVDPIVEEVRRVRKELDKELEEDPKAFFERINEHAKKWALKEATIKPLSFSSKRSKKA